MTCKRLLHVCDYSRACVSHVLLMTGALIYRTQICVTICVCNNMYPRASIDKQAHIKACLMPRHISWPWYVLTRLFVRIHVLLLTCVLMAACYMTPMCVTSKCTWTCMHVDVWVVTVPVRASSVHPPGWSPLAGRGVEIWKQSSNLPQGILFFY